MESWHSGELYTVKNLRALGAPNGVVHSGHLNLVLSLHFMIDIAAHRVYTNEYITK